MSARSRCRRVVAMALLLPGAALADDRIERARQIASDFQRALGAELRWAMTEGGPLQAIEVCSEQAPSIAAQASEHAGAAVSRTALRLRNPANAPDEDARSVLVAFAERLRNGEPQPIEHIETRADGSLRYLRAIVMQPLCLTCHGPSLAPSVARAIAARYPQDRATGFEVGQLRGAFLIDWPAAAPTAQAQP